MRVELQEISKVIMGQSPKGESYNEDGIGLPLLNGAADYKGNIFKPKKHTSEPTRVAQKGDILLGIRATIGNFAFSDSEYCIGRGVAAIRVDEKKAHKGYILKCVERELSRIIHRAAGSTIKGIKKEDLTEMKLNLPPLDQQKKIASILDAADNYRQKTKALIEKYDELTQSMFLDMFGDPVANNMKWKVDKLKDLSIKIGSGNTPKGGQKVYVKEGITFFRSMNVWKNNIVYDDIAFIDMQTHSKMPKSSLKHKDILMTKTGRVNTENSSLGRAALYLGEDDKANVNGHVYLIRLKEDVLHEFVLHILTSKEYRDHIRRVCVGGIDKRQLNKDHIEDFPIIAPPLDMQERFVNNLKITNNHKEKLEKSLAQAEDLFNSLLQRAFKGELTS